MAEPLAIPENDDPELEAAALDQADTLSQVQSYIQESRDARKGGDKPRDDAWSENWKAYHAAYDYSNKESWQSKLHLPDFGNFVDRFAATMKLAWRHSPVPFEARDSLDPTDRLQPLVEKALGVFLDRSGTNESGQAVGFSTTFGDCMHSGAMMNAAASVTWEGRVKIDPVDPRELYYDPTGRGRYRIRHYETEKWKLEELARDPNTGASYDLTAIESLDGTTGEPTEDKEESSQSDMDATADGRTVIQVHEFLGYLTDRDGKLQGGGAKQLVMVADERVLIRGPEPNPNKHGRDWIVYCPLLRIPFSVYHKTYAENFKELAAAFIEFTNLISDAVYSMTMPMYQGWAGVLEDPAQIEEGAHPNKIWWADEESSDVGKRFMIPLDPPRVDMGAAVSVWQGIKQEMREAANQNELGLGQLAQGEKTATEITDAREGTQVLISSIADTVDDGFISPIIELAWLTAVQHLTDNRDQEANGKTVTDQQILAELGPEIAQMIVTRRDEFLGRSFRFTVKAIRGVLERAQRVRGLVATLNIIGSNPLLAQAFTKKYSLDRLVEVLLTDQSVDVKRLEKTDQERMQDVLQNVLPAGGAGQEAGGSAAEDPVAGVLPGFPAPPGARGQGNEE